MATRTGHPVCFNLNQMNSHPDVSRGVLDSLTEIHRRGLPIYPQGTMASVTVVVTSGQSGAKVSMAASPAEPT